MMNSIIIAPSSLDYKITKCPRCFYLDKKLKIAVDSYPPPLFSNFDVVLASSSVPICFTSNYICVHSIMAAWERCCTFMEKQRCCTELHNVTDMADISV